MGPAGVAHLARFVPGQAPGVAQDDRGEQRRARRLQTRPEAPLRRQTGRLRPVLGEAVRRWAGRHGRRTRPQHPARARGRRARLLVIVAGIARGARKGQPPLDRDASPGRERIRLRAMGQPQQRALGPRGRGKIQSGPPARPRAPRGAGEHSFITLRDRAGEQARVPRRGQRSRAPRGQRRAGPEKHGVEQRSPPVHTYLTIRPPKKFHDG